jgi:hypothetical protein
MTGTMTAQVAKACEKEFFRFYWQITIPDASTHHDSEHFLYFFFFYTQSL